MEKLLTIAEVVVAVMLTASILLQQRGTGLGGAFGGDSSVYRSRRGAERLLFRITIVLAVLFGLIAILALFLH